MQKQRGLPDEALKSYQQGLEVARKAKEANAEASCQVAIGDLYAETRR